MTKQLHKVIVIDVFFQSDRRRRSTLIPNKIKTKPKIFHTFYRPEQGMKNTNINLNVLALAENMHSLRLFHFSFFKRFLLLDSDVILTYSE